MPSVSRFLLGLCLAPPPEDAPHHLAGAASGPHRGSPPARPRCRAVSGCQAALPERHTAGRRFNDKNPLSHSSEAGSPGSRCWQGGSRRGRCPRSEMATSPPCPHTASFLCRTVSLPRYGDASPVRPHPVTSLNLNHLRKAPSPGSVRVGRGLQRTDWGETQFSP